MSNGSHTTSLSSHSSRSSDGCADGGSPWARALQLRSIPPASADSTTRLSCELSMAEHIVGQPDMARRTEGGRSMRSETVRIRTDLCEVM